MKGGSKSVRTAKAQTPGRLDIAKLLAGKELMVVGGTGFLGKVWCSLLLARYPQIGRLHLVVRRRGSLSGSERFWQETLHNEAFAPVREQHGAQFEAFMREKVLPLEGDIVLPRCGVPEAVRQALHGNVAALVNASGVVDFEPPLDVGLEVNAFGVKNLVQLAHALGDCPLLHTSTCFVAGRRTGFVEEVDPRLHPFPRANELPRAHWAPEREIRECLSIIEQAKQRAEDAFRQSHFHAEAQKNLAQAHEPTIGVVFEREVEKVKRAYVEARLAEMGNERARYWGWPNTYTYTKSIGEQIVMDSGLRVTIVRPAIVETSVQFPMRGWNEGINTSAPLIYAIREGQTQLPGAHYNLDMIPCDMVAGGMMMALGELLEGTAPAVYQLGASDTNPVTMARVFELTGLYKRKHHLQQKGVVHALQAHVEGALFSREGFDKYGPARVAKAARGLSGVLTRLGRGSALGAVLKPATLGLDDFARLQERVARLLTQFAPFTTEYDYTFRCDHVRAARARLSPEERHSLFWEPEAIDWREWFMQVHAPALERWVFPEIEKRKRRPPRAKQAHETLPALLNQMSERHDLAVAVQGLEHDGLSRFSYRDVQAGALGCAAQLIQAGVKPGDRVLLIAGNHPAWPMALFGAWCAAATAVPLSPSIDAEALQQIATATGAKVCLADRATRERLSAAEPHLRWLDLQHSVSPGAPDTKLPACKAHDAALWVYTGGTTGSAKAVLLSQQNLTRTVAALATVLPLTPSDRLLNVLPLHLPLEITCGLLLPLSRGARVVYAGGPQEPASLALLQQVRPTMIVGAPVVWQGLERSLIERVEQRGKLSTLSFQVALQQVRQWRRTTGVEVGRVLFAPLHQALGGELRFAVSGGGAIPAATRETFATLGLPLSETYGLTEACALLSVSSPGVSSGAVSSRVGARAAHVGKLLPGLELHISNPNTEGVGEVWVKGPQVMLGYADDVTSTQQVLGSEGWLHTGDLGRLDAAGKLWVLGRLREVIVLPNGSNLYPEEVEAQLGKVASIDELCVVGVLDDRGLERAVCVAVPAPDPNQTQYERVIGAKAALAAALAKLPPEQRPSEQVILDHPLPRAAARNVQRLAVRRLVEQRFRTERLGAAQPVR